MGQISVSFPFGALRTVALPGGTELTYGVDAQGRRTSRSVTMGSTTTTRRYLYSGARLVAELDATGQVVSQYVYGTRPNVPEYMVKGGITYRLVTDHLGSVRFVVNSSTGAIAQQLSYDAFGRVLTDSAPGFQPFGFAGGLYDPLTGLVRFGARDYDPETGRWTAKDPIRFDGGDTNLYAYVGGDPVNWVDPSGLAPKGPGATFDSPEEAALDWAEYMETVPDGDQVEWASDLYRTTPWFGGYSYTRPIQCGDEECKRPPFMMQWPVTKVAECHTHPIGIPGSETISDYDWWKARNRGPLVDSFIRTGDRHVWRLKGGSGRRTMLK